MASGQLRHRERDTGAAQEVGDVTTTLGEQFLRAGTDTITHRGRIVKALVRIPVADGAEIVVRRRAVGGARPQALKLAVNSGLLEVNERSETAVALWSTTSPDTVSLVVRGAEATTIDVWNAWSMGGVDCSWIGNAGMVTKTTAAGTVLRCSDGIGSADFSDLEVEIAVVD